MRAIAQLYDEVLQPTGLRGIQLALMMVISIHQPVTIQELAEVTVTDRAWRRRATTPA